MLERLDYRLALLFRNDRTPLGCYPRILVRELQLILHRRDVAPRHLQFVLLANLSLDVRIFI